MFDMCLRIGLQEQIVDDVRVSTSAKQVRHGKICPDVDSTENEKSISCFFKERKEW